MKNGKKSTAGHILKGIGIAVAVVILIVLIYVAYVFLSYHRIGDQNLTVTKPESAADRVLETGTSYKALSWNIGFGAYTADYDFFMDGGKQSRAVKDRLEPNLIAIAELIAGKQADFCLLEEVDIGGTRTWGVDERAYMINAMPGYSYTFAQNYDSAYLMYPVLDPHGANRSGLMMMSCFTPVSAERVELPIETGVSKLIDLDRCYMKTRIPVAGGSELVIYTFHLSAYTSDGTVAVEQLSMLLRDMQQEYENGNYCLAGGDFNKDILGNSAEVFVTNEVMTWAQPLPKDLFDGLDLSLVTPGTDAPTCRNPDSAYHEGQFVVTVDGFIVSNNITVDSCRVEETGFAYSDHEPVQISFILKASD